MAPFETLDDLRALLPTLPPPDEAARARAVARDATLTKPPGALGALEGLGAWLASWQGTERPRIERPLVALFAGNHGVAARGVSAFPPEVTAQMVLNFERGGAAVNQVAAAVGARLTVTPLAGLRPTADFTERPAMTEGEAVAALRAGWAAAGACDLLVPGEMGIGNTTAAAAIAHALLGGAPGDWVGRGTGVDEAGLARKRAAVAAGAARHGGHDALETLRRLGGHEVAAMAGAILGARARRVPVLLDGFICGAAALVVARAVPGGLLHVRAGHRGAEAAHGRLLDALGLRPLLALDLRLGEGTGGALAIPVVRAAAACLSGMASFAEAGVSGEVSPAPG